jgi:hypothetical protein
MSKDDKTSTTIEDLVDKEMNDLVNTKLESGEKITDKEITAKLTKAYKEANKLGLITEGQLEELTKGKEITESVPQEPKIETVITGEAKKIKEEYSDFHTLETLEESAEILESAGLTKDANKLREKYTEIVEIGEIKKIPQPDKIVGTGVLEPSKLEESVKKAMGGKKSVSVPEFKESTWQKIKNFLHVGKGHEARKQEHVKKFSKDLINQAKNIGARAKNTSSIKPTDQKVQINKNNSKGGQGR